MSCPRTRALAATITAATPGTPPWRTAVEEAITINSRLIDTVARRMIRQYAIEPSDHADVVSEVRIAMMDCLTDWDPTRSDLAKLLFFEALGRIRTFKEHSTGYAGAVTARRRYLRANRIRRELRQTLGRRPTDDEVVDENNRRALRSQRKPYNSGSLLTVAELHRATAAFAPRLSLDAVGPNIARRDGDTGHAPQRRRHITTASIAADFIGTAESRQLIKALVTHLETALDKITRDVFVATYRLDGNVADVGRTRPLREVARLVGVTVPAARAALAHARTVAAAYLAVTPAA